MTPAAAKPAPAKSVAALIQQANSAPATPPQSAAAKPSAAAAAKPTSPPPAMKPAMTSTTPVATGAPHQLVVPVAPKPAAPVAEAAKPAAGGYVLQIGAYKSQGDAEAAWKTYKVKHAALLSGYADDIQQADLGEKGTWYRLRVGGLSDREVATALCERLKADGGACILGK